MITNFFLNILKFMLANASMEQEALYICIGKQIKRLRELRAISQQELAALCDFEKSNMSRIEAGKTNPTIGTLHKIASALSIELKVFFNFEELDKKV